MQCQSIVRWMGAAGLCASVLTSGCRLAGGQSGEKSNAISRQTLIPAARDIRKLHGAPEALPKELAKVTPENYFLQTGEILEIDAYYLDGDQTQFFSVRTPILKSTDRKVDGFVQVAEGEIDLGDLGRVTARDRTCEQVEKDVVKLLEKTPKGSGRAFRVVVSVASDTKYVYVLGSVANETAVDVRRLDAELDGRATVLDGILKAGGLAKNADVDRIILSRPTPEHGCRVVLPICYNQIVQLGDTSTNYQLMPGDRIFVPAKTCLSKFHKKDKGPCCNVQVGCPPTHVDAGVHAVHEEPTAAAGASIPTARTAAKTPSTIK